MKDAFDQLVAAGKARGYLSVEEVSRLVPLSELTTEQLAELILRIEQEGIRVELDPGLLKVRAGNRRSNTPASLHLTDAHKPSEEPQRDLKESIPVSSTSRPKDAASKRMPFAVKAGGAALLLMFAFLLIWLIIAR